MREQEKEKRGKSILLWSWTTEGQPERGESRITRGGESGRVKEGCVIRTCNTSLGGRCHLHCPDWVGEGIAVSVDQSSKAPLGGQEGCCHCPSSQHLHFHTHLGKASLMQDTRHLWMQQIEMSYFSSSPSIVLKALLLLGHTTKVFCSLYSGC